MMLVKYLKLFIIIVVEYNRLTKKYIYKAQENRWGYSIWKNDMKARYDLWQPGGGCCLPPSSQERRTFEYNSNNANITWHLPHISVLEENGLANKYAQQS